MAVVLVDVDGTVITGSSLKQFFARYAKHTPDHDLKRRIRDLTATASTHPDHGRLIADALGLFTGQSWEDICAVGRAWFKEQGRPQLIPAITERIRTHQRNGDVVIFVSASWIPCLQPIADHLGVEHILCTQVDIENGLLTGTVGIPAYGAEKVSRVTAFLRTHNLNLQDSVGYGDDPTDLAMLTMTEHPTTVGNNPQLLHKTITHHWENIPISGLQ